MNDVENKHLKSSIEFPPILSDFKTELEDYIVQPDKLVLYHIDKVQQYYDRKASFLSLLRSDISPLGTTIVTENDPIAGSLKDNRETNLHGIGETVRNSMSLSRIPGPPEEGVKGNTSNFLFWPGGFEDKTSVKTKCVVNFEKNLLTKAPGFKEGVEFGEDNFTPVYAIKKKKKVSKNRKIKQDEKAIDIFSLINTEAKEIGPWPPKINMKPKRASIDLSELDEVINQIWLSDLQLKKDVLKISEHSNDMRMEWAENVDVSIPILDFKQRIPNPALTFPYELDTFQKQAILKLEENCNVFVAAHTSAGKTTIAEYAIALTQRHMTKAVYTSPIKALSNQKFRDFKDKFGDVGLITGDVQINLSASCLIMTTEILQTMLYCASDVIRDLEYVIFDEVHYINNEERGHVWEEIVILLPSSVNIIMLSATIPQPLKFANWVGQIKKRKMYVISTKKRPVALEHYLYTAGCDESSGKQICILNKDNTFLRKNVQLVKALIHAEQKAEANTRNAWRKKLIEYRHQINNSAVFVNTDHVTQGTIKKVAIRQGNAENVANANMELEKKPKKNVPELSHAERVMWSSFLDHLQAKDLIPAVVFTFSRVRCLTVVDAISTNLLNREEMTRVEEFFTKSVKRLNESDVRLPQVIKMQALLTKGIGIHHSGVLPILKEIVEMLFQKGLVKLLFATETFAMGVNMPARTVIFDAIRKFDGYGHRDLLPAEYIQMAGRAGRRGHDTIGTVIILCKQEPYETRLMKMICGEPQQLESKFRVTYSMILHFRRLSDSLSVKDMMRRSFREAYTLSREKESKAELLRIESELQDIPRDKDHLQMSAFYDVGLQYSKAWQEFQSYALLEIGNFLNGGRVLLITYKHHIMKLGVLLQVVSREKTYFQVLVLSDSESSAKIENSDQNMDNYYTVLGYLKSQLFHPVGEPSHEVLAVPLNGILQVTNKYIISDCTSILRDWGMRQTARYRNDEPCPETWRVVKQLKEMTIIAIQSQMQNISPFITGDHSTVHPALISTMTNLISRLTEKKNSLDMLNFEARFELFYRRKCLMTRQAEIKRMLSDEYMRNYPEYLGRVAVLKELGYIDQSEQVTLKGRVALEMQSHELLLTELIFKNILVSWEPAEIAALLSALIMPPRFNSEMCTENPRLVELQKQMEIEYNDLKKIEDKLDLDSIPAMNFHLVHVVYEWAEAKSFADITQLTDVQEGIIVRCIQQLNEMLRYVKNASVIIGNPILQEKTMEALRRIKRDIVFTESLYTQE